MDVKAPGVIAMASARDDAGKTTGLFIVSAPGKEVGESFPFAPLPSPVAKKTISVVFAYEEARQPEQLQPAKSILKAPKEINAADLDDIPPPIQRSARLSPRALIRLTPLPHGSKKRVPRTPKIQFADDVQWFDTWSVGDYDRAACEFAAKTLTPVLAAAIKKELNELKAEMDVHEDSRDNTQYYRI